MSTRRSLLEQVTGAPLAKSCDVPWSAMAGGDRFRRCAECDREVWNLSAMTAREAEIRLLNAAEWPCVNYRVDDERRLISRDEPRPIAPRRLALGAAAFVATTMLAPGRGAADATPPKQSDKTPQGEKAQGDKTSGNLPQAEKRNFKPEDCPQVAAAAPAPAGSAAMNPPPPPPLGGAPPPPREMPPAGTVVVKSAKPRDLVIDGVTFHAPSVIRLPPGKHEAQIKDGKKTTRRAFEVKLDGTFVIDLDK